MPRKLKIKLTKIKEESRIIKPSRIDEAERVSFNFRRLQNRTDKFDFRSRGTRYFNCLIDRLCEISKMNKRELTVINRGSHCGLRCHPIDFLDEKVTEDGFGIPGNKELDDDAWQFSISANEHGRVHGYFVGKIFYIVWFDPEHNLSG